jgi:hypothetical protein
VTATQTATEKKPEKNAISSTPSLVNNTSPVAHSVDNAPILKQSSIMGSYDESKHQKFLGAINEKNPLALKTLEEQGASIQAKVIRLNSNPAYQKLDARGKLRVRYALYNQFVVPAYTNANAKPPDLKAWLLGTTADQIGKINPEEAFQSKSIQAAHDFVAGAMGTATKLVMAGAGIAQAHVDAVLGLDKYFTKLGGSDTGIKVLDAVSKTENKYFDLMKSKVDSVADSQNFYLENHPRKGFLASAPGWTGEQVAMLPLYAAINPVTKGVGEAAVGVGERILGTKAVGNLTKTLIGSKIGQFVGNRIVTATAKFLGRSAEQGATGFIAGKTLGESNKQSGIDAATFAVVGGLLEGVGAGLKGAVSGIDKLAGFDRPPASGMAIKEWTANNIAMGGRPFVEAIHAQADLEEGQDRILAKAEEHGIPAGTKERVEAARAKRETDDPTTHALVKAQRYSYNSLAQRHYGTSYGNLGDAKRNIIKARQLELMSEAEYEMPALVPDLNKEEVQSDHEKQIAESPAYAAASRYLDQMFPDQSEGGINEVNAQQVEANQIITGIKDNAKKAQEVQSVREQPLAKGDRITGDRFAQHRADSIAYFRNPSSGSQRLAADGTKIGSRDKRTWNERMKAENLDQFIDTLKAADKDMIHFENPYHRMLFHWANRRSLPKPVQDKLLREMKYYLASQKNPVFASAKEISAQADWNLVHLTKLAQSGRLVSEGNVFRSTQVNGQGTMTQWQGELDTELEKQEYETLKRSLTLYPDQKDLLTSAMNMLQSSRSGAKSPEEWLQYNAAINQQLKLGGIY